MYSYLMKLSSTLLCLLICLLAYSFVHLFCQGKCNVQLDGSYNILIRTLWDVTLFITR